MSFNEFVKNEWSKFTVVFVPLVALFLIHWSSVVLGYEKTFLDGFNNAQGFIAVFAVIMAVIVWATDDFLKRVKHRKKQEQYLKLVLAKLDYLAGSDIMTIFGTQKRISVVDWYHQAVSNGNFPSHRLPTISADFFAKELDDYIDGKPTFELKKALFFIRDKIDMANFWWNQLMQQNLLIDTTQQNKNAPIAKRHEEALRLMVDATMNLKKFVAQTRIHIQERFGPKLPPDEK